MMLICVTFLVFSCVDCAMLTTELRHVQIDDIGVTTSTLRHYCRDGLEQDIVVILVINYPNPAAIGHHNISEILVSGRGR